MGTDDGRSISPKTRSADARPLEHERAMRTRTQT